MNKSIKTEHLVIGGLIAIMIGSIFHNNVFAEGLGVIGLFCFLSGSITYVITKSKGK